MLVLLVLSVSYVNRRLGPPGRLIASAQRGGLNKIEMQEMERGYYEDLMDVDRFNGDLWRLYSKRPRDWTEHVVDAGLATKTSNILRYEMKPSVAGMHRGVILRTNRWGMHDKDYTQERPPGCFRIALLGSSHAMGLGVTEDQTFEAVLENRLNRENAVNGRSYEILNFAVTGYPPTPQVWMLKDKVLQFNPQLVILVGQHHDAERAAYELMKAVRDKIELPDPYLRELIGRANVDSETPPPLIQRRLKPYAENLLSWVFERLVSLCNDHGIKPVYVLIPIAPGAKDNAADMGPDVTLAARAGFTVIDLFDAYDGYSWQKLWISEWDTHPNPLGHKLLAERLYQRLRESNLIPITDRDRVSKASPADEPAEQNSH